MSITLDQVTKRYQDSPVVNDVSLNIGDGEFFVLLGPSGSGKSTLLRAIAGLSGVDHGRISLHGRDVTHVAARQRGVGLVFQNYALFRHMSVADNIEFALRVRRVRAAERRQRRQELLRLVALEGMDERLPAQLSGGQQQRVAVARALAHKPEVLLLDEPFGALDAKIREELRRTIRQVQRELGITTVLVTHDQEEAFALADRIGVMNLGRLLEVGRPQELYARPATRFVATFLGAANLILAHQTRDGIRFGKTPVSARAVNPLRGARDHEVVAVVRPEEIEIAATRENLSSGYLARGTVDELVFTGALERIRVRIEDSADATTLEAAGAPVLEVTRTQHEQRAFEVKTGQPVVIGVRRVHVLPTPLSSFTICAATEAEADALNKQRLLTELAARMQTRIATRVESSLALSGNDPGGTVASSGAAAVNGAPAVRSAAVSGATAGGDAVGGGTVSGAPAFGGTIVIAWHPQVVRKAQWLLQQGAEEVLVLPAQSSPPHRVFIHWVDESVRHGTLAVSASILRHVSAEAVYVGILPPDTPAAQRPHGMRALLDARSEAQAVHGLEMRTEMRYGEVTRELSELMRESDDPMLILGIHTVTDLTGRLHDLFNDGSRPLLIVHRQRATDL